MDLLARGTAADDTSIDQRHSSSVAFLCAGANPMIALFTMAEVGFGLLFSSSSGCSLLLMAASELVSLICLFFLQAETRLTAVTLATTVASAVFSYAKSWIWNSAPAPQADTAEEENGGAEGSSAGTRKKQPAPPKPLNMKHSLVDPTRSYSLLLFLFV